eukprot:147685-Prorocentrum_lima.AAC.1
MTSSLVGSEMCIRDRPSTQNRATIQSATHIKEELTHTTAATTPDAVNACLLYTSDAADDM